MDKAFSEEDEEGALPPIFESAKENFLKVETLALNNVYKMRRRMKKF